MFLLLLNHFYSYIFAFFPVYRTSMTKKNTYTIRLQNIFIKVAVFSCFISMSPLWQVVGFNSKNRATTFARNRDALLIAWGWNLDFYDVICKNKFVKIVQHFPVIVNGKKSASSKKIVWAHFLTKKGFLEGRGCAWKKWWYDFLKCHLFKEL